MSRDTAIQVETWTFSEIQHYLLYSPHHQPNLLQTYILFEMLRRQLLRQTRAICNPESLLHQTRSSSFSQLRQHTTPRHPSAFPQRIWQRYQSTEATKESTDPNAVAPDQPPQDTSKASEIPAENPLQKDLDAKSKEVIALKVYHARQS
jgi:hypothetical protein